MASLKEPQKSIPGGYVFLQPETGWTPTPFSSLDSITQQLIQHRQGRPDIVAKNNLPTDPSTVRKEVESYNVAVCIRNGWTDYIVGGASEHVPFTPPPKRSLFQKLKGVAAGGETIVEWIQDGAPTVSVETATKRASICCGGGDSEKKCPKNGKGGLETYFTVPVSNAIRKQIERKNHMKLETPYDDQMVVCEGCDCPLPLKVFLPIDKILSGINPDQKAALDSRCWILAEEKELTKPN